ncbi:MAG: hypothetical protein ACYDAJ_07315 [Nitrosotalea sp.]
MDDFQLYLQIDITTPLKKQQKQETSNQLIEQLLSSGCKSVQLNDMHYIDKKSVESLNAIVIILDITASVSTIVASSLSIYSELKNHKNKGVVFLKRKNGDYVKINENMTAEDAIKELNKNGGKEESKS